MTIKARLILSTGVLLCLATTVISVVAISAVTDAMTGRVDAQLREYLRQPQNSADTRLQPALMLGRSSPQTSPAFQAVAVLVVDAEGNLVSADNAGYYTDPLPLPELPNPLPTDGKPLTATSADGTTDYRVLAVGALVRVAVDPVTGEETKVAGRLVLAAPLTEVGTVRGQLVTTMAVTVAAVLLLSLLASWWITRRGLRPVGDMIDTAAAIAEGDLTRRVARRPGHGELGRLATALNTMVSRLVRAIGERETQQERLRRFVADASHELRTPLSTIGGYADLYESGGARSGPMLDRAMSRIRAENLRMAALVDDMLLLARLDQEAEQVYGACDLSRVVTDSVDDARAVDAERVVVAEVEPGVVVTGDEARLRQVLANLLANARLHTPPGTTVTVGLRDEGGRAVLVVADDGPGMDEEHRARAFDRLYRADPSRSRATGGSGLGLSIVASIVAAHRGTVAMAGSPGGGTHVVVDLPPGR
ncbi:HAMP domain-containing sensor histidine kinase [Phytomonospora sp. NPDC050363]|uniref:sensor histidine kinase n=1 Tax=Phytomonospora sp. NPDC050363 TaxID=3155642 RepID=UPI003407B321